MNIPRDKTVQDLFKWRVEQTPDLVAHKFLDRETSYKINKFLIKFSALFVYSGLILF